MPLGDDHYEPVVVQKEAATEKKKTETSTVAGGKAPSGYVDTFVREVPKAAQQAASAVGNAVASAVNPIHKTDTGEVDWGATGVHAGADVVGALVAKDLLSTGIKKAVGGDPLASQNAAMLKIAKMEAETAAAQRAHEIELAKLKAAGVVQTAPTTATPVTTTPTATSPTSTPTPTLAQINAATAAPPPTGTTLAPVAAPTATEIKTIEELDAERARLDADHEARMKEHNRLFPTESPSLETLATPETTTPLTKEVGKEPKEGPMVKQGIANTEKNAIAERQQAKAAQKQTFKTPAELPEGTVFKQGWGGADSWLNDQVGKEKAKAIRNTYNQGRGFGSGAEAIKNAAMALSEFGNTQFMTQGEPTILSKENRQRFGIPPPQQSGALNKTFPKAVKVGGLAGLLLTANEAANAKNLREAAGTVGEAFLPIGMTPTTAGAPVVPPSRFTEAAKLGSPYYNTDWAKQQRAR
jgi:hypothetical protein